MSRVIDAVSQYFALLAEPMRIRILQSICREEKTVSQIVAETGATQTNVSRHLGSMYRAGVLTRRKDGNFIFYGVGDEAIIDICRSMCIHIANKLGADRSDEEDLLALASELDRGGAAQAGEIDRNI